jgi:putative DNA primase/helicase
MPTDRLDDAMGLAVRGWKIFPLHTPLGADRCSCSRGATCANNGKHPRTEHGLRDATASPTEVGTWWTRWPDANIGLPTGDVATVLDVDPRHGGDDALRLLQDTHGPLPETWRVLTGGGGAHIYFQPVPGLRNSSSLLGPGLDIRGVGGYVVAPPSSHPSGRQWEWEIGFGPDEVPLAPMPEWMVTALQQPRGTGEAATDAEWVQRFSGVSGGQRNDTATKCAGYLAGQGLGPDLIAEILLGFGARCTPPIDRDEAAAFRDIARRIWERDQAQRRARAGEDIGSHWTDYGHAVQLVRRYGEDIRYTQAMHWRVWVQGRYRVDDNGYMAKFAKTMLRTRYEEAARLDPRQRAVFMDHLIKTESQARIDALLASAQSEPEVSCVEADFDTDPHLFNVRNGTLDLRTLRLYPHRREDLITKLSPVAYDPDATAPRFSAFLTDTFPNGAIRAYVQRVFGYVLCGDTEEQCYFIFHGTGANGKSTLTDTARRIMGEYAHKTQVETLLASRMGGANYQMALSEMAALQGVRLALASEPETGRPLAESLLKDLTGGEQINARLLYREPFKYTPQFKLILSTNTRPPIQGMDHATWRRIRLVPFVHEVPEFAQEKDLKRTLWRERSGILNWMLAGYRQWQTEGLATPPEIEESTREYRESEDSVQTFVEECCTTTRSSARTSAGDLYDSYTAWARQNGERPISKKALGLAFDRMGFARDRPGHSQIRHRCGIELNENAPRSQTAATRDDRRREW